MNDIHRKLLAAFQVEHRDHLEAVRSLLDVMEQNGWAAEADALVELHRRIHSLKGAARAVDLKPIETLSHRLESAIERYQQGACTMNEAAGRTMRGVLDAIEDGVAAALRGEDATPPEDILTGLDALQSGPETQVEDILIDAEPVPSQPIPSVAGGQEHRDNEHDREGESFRVDARSLDGLLECAGELLTASVNYGRFHEDFHGLEQIAAHCVRTANSLGRKDRQATYDDEWAPVTDQSSFSLQTLQSQVRDLSDSLRSLERRYLADAWELSQLGRKFDQRIRHARMVPADSVFGSARKMVRDLLRDQGKEARVDVRGLQCLADRWVLQEIKDPVMHALRNAVSHGIETPDERTSARKPREGRILLEISLQGSRLSVRIEDDGRGVDIERIRRVAQAKGLMPAQSDDQLDNHAIGTILSQPGFSTAENVTELAGRGIGLSVVTQAVTKLRGDFRIGEREGGGTVVTILVPMVVSSEPLVVVACGDTQYSLPAHGIARFVRLQRDQLDSVEGRPVLIEDDRPPLPLAPLPMLLGASEYAITQNGPMSVAVLEAREMQIGAVVDSVVSVRNGMVRNIGIGASNSKLVAGGLVTEAGSVVPVLSVPALIEAYFQSVEGWNFADIADAERTRTRTVLVVDDSITTRTLEKSILEANGFQVRVSVDGSSALALLRKEPVDLVVSDVEMPVMDGFELLRAIRQDSALAHTPVILVTSRSKDEDRRRGLTLGADAYVVKQRFDQNALLESIMQLI